MRCIRRAATSAIDTLSVASRCCPFRGQRCPLATFELQLYLAQSPQDGSVGIGRWASDEAVHRVRAASEAVQMNAVFELRLCGL
jgi:hypothetical protein